MDWFFLILAGLCEVAGVAAIARFNERKNLLNGLFLVLGFGTSFLLLTLALETISMGTAYAVWTGIGTAGSALFGILFLKEPAEWKRVLFIALIISATVGLKFLPS